MWRSHSVFLFAFKRSTFFRYFLIFFLAMFFISCVFPLFLVDSIKVMNFHRKFNIPFRIRKILLFKIWYGAFCRNTLQCICFGIKWNELHKFCVRVNCNIFICIHCWMCVYFGLPLGVHLHNKTLEYEYVQHLSCYMLFVNIGFSSAWPSKVEKRMPSTTLFFVVKSRIDENLWMFYTWLLELSLMMIIL